MTALSIQPTYPIFTDIDGQPLEDGYIWIGVANLQPIGNPITVYWDAALTIPAVQPIRTRGGYPVNSGTPARLYVNSDYSIQVQNKNGSVVYSAPTATERYSGVVINGVNAQDVVYDPPFTNAVQTNVEAKLAQTVSVKDFGAVGDGVADDTAAIQAAINAFNNVVIPLGTYKTTDSIVLSTSKSLHLDGATLSYQGSSDQPVVRIISAYAHLTGSGRAVITSTRKTGNLNDPTLEGLVNCGPISMTAPKVDINFCRVSGIEFFGSQSAYSSFMSGLSQDIDDYIGLKLVNGQALAGVAAGSVYDNFFDHLQFRCLGTGIDCEPVVQGNMFNMLDFFDVVKSGIRFRGCNENAVSNTFHDGGPCEAMVRLETVPLKIASASGAFTNGETVTGGTSGATLVLDANNGYNATQGLMFGVRVGTFVAGETLTGGTSGQTATVDATRFQYRMSSAGVGRTSAGNSVIAFNGEPAQFGPSAFGSVPSRFVQAQTRCNGNYIQGRGNTGNSVIDFGLNTIFQVTGGIFSKTPFWAQGITALDSTSQGFSYFDPVNRRLGINTITPTAKLDIQPASAASTEILARQYREKKYAAQQTLAAGEKLRFRFTGASRQSYGFVIKAKGVNDGSNTFSRHPSAVIGANVMCNSNATSISFDVQVIYASTFVVGNFTAAAVGAGFQFDIEVANPTVDPGTYSVMIEALDPINGLVLDSISVV